MSNVVTHGDVSPSVGVVPDASPEVRKPSKGKDLTKRGVRKECLEAKRKEFPRHPSKQWFVLKATYNREKQAYKYFKRHKITAYLPVRRVKKDVDGKTVKAEETLLPCLVFVYDEPEKVREYVRERPSLSYVHFYYNMFKTNENSNHEPVVLDYDEMLNFIVVTSVKNPFVRIVSEKECKFKSGDMVRVTQGDFKGVVGRVARVDRQSCVVVNVKGLCMVATAYIPGTFLEYTEKQ